MPRAGLAGRRGSQRGAGLYTAPLKPLLGQPHTGPLWSWDPPLPLGPLLHLLPSASQAWTTLSLTRSLVGTGLCYTEDGPQARLCRAKAKHSWPLPSGCWRDHERCCRPSALLPDGATSPEAGAEAVTAGTVRKSSPGTTREVLGEGCRLNARESLVERPCEEQEGRASGEGCVRWTRGGLGSATS